MIDALTLVSCVASKDMPTPLLRATVARSRSTVFAALKRERIPKPALFATVVLPTSKLAGWLPPTLSMPPPALASRRLNVTFAVPSLTIPAPLNDPVTRVNAKLAVPETTTTLPPVPRRIVRFVKLAVAPPPTSNAGACAPVASMIVCRALVPDDVQLRVDRDGVDRQGHRRHRDHDGVGDPVARWPRSPPRAGDCRSRCPAPVGAHPAGIELSPEPMTVYVSAAAGAAAARLAAATSVATRSLICRRP